jgi:L-lactate dehydrogenase complex protein LldF
MSEMSPLRFKDNAIRALGDAELQRALGNMRQGFIERRTKAAERLPEFDALRDKAKEIRDHVLAHLGHATLAEEHGSGGTGYEVEDAFVLVKG